MSRYVLKEYGSWGVMTLSFLTGILVGSSSYSFRLLPAYLAICLLINAKQALTLWSRSTGTGRQTHAGAFFIQVVPASLMLVFLLGGGIANMLPFAAIPVVYVILNRFAGEHAIITEIAGFASLSSAVLISKYLSSGQVDYRLYVATALFFNSGVFKVRIQFKKRALDRVTMVLYLLCVAAVYYLIGTPLVALLPLADNLIFAVTLYHTRLRTTGWTEVLKGTGFLLLMALSY
jgi:hypothetical protein